MRLLARPCRRVVAPWGTDGPLPTRSRFARPAGAGDDPTLGIEVPRGAAAPAKHRLVTVGDSLTHGFMSAAVHRTDLSWPAITAYELGLTAEQFTFPTYEWPTGPGGLPLDLERLARAFEKRFGAASGLLGDRDGGAVAALLHGSDRGLLGTRRGFAHSARRAAVPQHGGLRVGPPRPPAPHLDHGRLPAGPPDDRTIRSPSWWSTTRTGPPGRSCSGPARATAAAPSWTPWPT